jgi:hypothetical protein
MDKMELQNAAEGVVDLEANITSWTGNVSQWIRELSRLHETIEELIRVAFDSNDPIEKAFVKCLQLKMDKCREYVLKRSDRTDIRTESGLGRVVYCSPSNN